MSDPYKLEGTELWQSRIVSHTNEDPADLLAHPLNFRIHSELQQSATVGSLDTLGFVKSIIVNRATGTVIDGHERIMLAMRKPGQTVPVEWVMLNEEEEAVALMSLDYIASMAGIDGENLRALASSVEVHDVDLMAAIDNMLDKYSFGMNQNPAISVKQFDSDDVDNAREGLANQFDFEQKLISLNCPHCGKEFEVDRLD